MIVPGPAVPPLPLPLSLHLPSIYILLSSLLSLFPLSSPIPLPSILYLVPTHLSLQSTQVDTYFNGNSADLDCQSINHLESLPSPAMTTRLTLPRHHTMQMVTLKEPRTNQSSLFARTLLPTTCLPISPPQCFGPRVDVTAGLLTLPCFLMM